MPAREPERLPAVAVVPEANVPANKTQTKLGERTLITQLLSQFKQTSEVRQYMRYYGSVERDRFAIVKVSGDVLRNEEETARVAASLAFLHRIGLVPIVVHGAGLFTGRKGDLVASALGGPVARPARVMDAARQYMVNANLALVEALKREGVEATSLVGGVFGAHRDESRSAAQHLRGVTGRIAGVDVAALTSAVAAGSVPIVAAVANDARDGDLLTFPTQAAAIAIAKEVQPLKVIWLRPEGGLRTSDGEVIRAVDLCRDAPHLVAGLHDVDPAAEGSAEEFDTGSGAAELDLDATAAAAKRAAKAEVVREELDLDARDADSLVELSAFHDVLSEPGATVSVTTPESLAAELFSHKGAGTLITRGERIFAHSSLTTLDVPRLERLIEAAFGAALPSDYLSGLAASGRLKRVYVSEGYRGAAVVIQAPGCEDRTISYLDKFAVDPSAQGDKLGEVLWKAMVAREPRLFWRSRSSNRVNPWYYEQSHGCYKAGRNGNAAGRAKGTTGEWTVFWRNLDDAAISHCVDVALTLPPTFDKKVYTASGAAGSNDPMSPAQQPLLK